MTPKELKALATHYSTMAEVAEKISAIFSSAGGGDADDAGDEAPAKPVRGKPASTRKPAAKTKEAEITEDTVRAALKELAGTHGKEAMTEALAAVGAGRLPDVDEADYPDLMAAIEAAGAEEADEKPAAKAKPAKGKAKAKPEVDFDDMAEKFKELYAADRVSAKAVLKKAGIAKLSEVDQDDADAMQELLDAIEAALDDDQVPV